VVNIYVHLAQHLIPVLPVHQVLSSPEMVVQSQHAHLAFWKYNHSVKAGKFSPATQGMETLAVALPYPGFSSALSGRSHLQE
jgi:hypothetical protein